MSENVVSFRELTPEKALEHMRRLAERSSRIGLRSHSRKRMRQRKVSWPQIQYTLSQGVPTEGPYQDLFGNWICRLEARVAGGRVAVVVKMVRETYLLIITAISR